MIEPLAQYRAKIDKIDEQLRTLLEERFNITEAIGRHKKEQGLPVLDAEREEVIETKQRRALTGSLQKEHIMAVMTLILTRSKQQQQDLHKDTR